VDEGGNQHTDYFVPDTLARMVLPTLIRLLFLLRLIVLYCCQLGFLFSEYA
jgi:hypothetical protein